MTFSQKCWWVLTSFDNKTTLWMEGVKWAIPGIMGCVRVEWLCTASCRRSGSFYGWCGHCSGQHKELLLFWNVPQLLCCPSAAPVLAPGCPRHFVSVGAACCCCHGGLCCARTVAHITSSIHSGLQDTWSYKENNLHKVNTDHITSSFFQIFLKQLRWGDSTRCTNK